LGLRWWGAAALVLPLMIGGTANAAPDQTFTGVITDDMCARADHSHMQMGPTDAECVLACIDLHGAAYVLYDGTSAYNLSDQHTPEKFAAQRVTVAGTLDTRTNTIQVASIAVAQHPAEFEVASIKPSPEQSDQGAVGIHVSGSQVHLAHMSLRDDIVLAYAVIPEQVSGPDWITQQRFDIAAKLPDGASATQVPEMMQQLLASRFGLKVHHESKDFPVYAIVVAKGGLQLKEVDPADAPVTPGTANVTAGGGARGVSIDLGGGSSFTLADNQLVIRKVTMATLARTLSRFADRPVVDGTGVAGTYDLTLDLSPEDYTATLVRTAVNAGVVLPPQALRVLDGASGNPFSGPLERFGLAMESRKSPFDVIVVDSVQKIPTQN
jgi:uncharacterized protein (TIGR03435 family)